MRAALGARPWRPSKPSGGRSLLCVSRWWSNHLPTPDWYGRLAMMSSSVMCRRLSVMSCGWTSTISSMSSQVVIKTAQVSPSRSPRVTRRMEASGKEGNRTPTRTKTPGTLRSRAPGSLDPWWRRLDLDDVRCAGSLRAVHDLETHAVALVEASESLSPDLGVMHEDVRPTLSREETETLRLVEPLHRTFDHERAGLLALPSATSPARPRPKAAHQCVASLGSPVHLATSAPSH